ncbi:MAG: ABC transporter ATP-binding protein [Acidimicrobiales bacterium]
MADFDLVADGVSKTYGDLVALHPTDLSVPAGQRVALIGHNGSGKSTFLKLAAGLLDPTDGAVEVSGSAAGSLDARAATSYVPDDPVLYDDLSVREHMTYISSLHGVAPEPEDIDGLLERLGLAQRADDLPVRFSRGLRQKASLALAFIRPFDVLLVDEPFVGLDAPGKEALLTQLETVHEAGQTILVATHDPSFVERVDRCVALRDGEVIHDGPATVADVLRLVGA